MFIPPINLGGWKPSPATMSEWIYQIWKYLQENPIATQEQIKEFINEQIGDDISEKLPEVLPQELADYFEENPIDFPVESVNGKLGAVLLELADIVQSDSMLPVVSLANDEADQETLVESFEAGARICVIDEESVSVMLPTYAQDGSVSAVTLLPMSTGSGSGDFSPITMSIGSSGNKTLNAGGTVAFTLTEIGAAPASVVSTVSSLSSEVGGIVEDVTTIQGDVTTIKSNITELQSTTRQVFHAGDKIEISGGFRLTGNFASITRFGANMNFPIIIGDDVTGFIMYNSKSTSNIVIRVATSSTNVISHPYLKNDNTYYASGTIISHEYGLLSVVLYFPQQSGTYAGYMGFAAWPSEDVNTIEFTGT